MLDDAAMVSSSLESNACFRQEQSGCNVECPGTTTEPASLCHNYSHAIIRRASVTRQADYRSPVCLAARWILFLGFDLPKVLSRSQPTGWSM